MFVSRRPCPGPAAWLLGSALAAALLTNVRTQVATEQLNMSHALATCLRVGQASLVATGAWQYFTGINLKPSSTVLCQLNVSVATKDKPFAAHLIPTSSSPTPNWRLLFRIDRLEFEERTPDAPDCPFTAFVTLMRSAARSDLLCGTTADRYAWLDDWLTVIIFHHSIFTHSARSILRFDASFAALLAMNVCEGGQEGAATLAVDDVTYAYAPDAWYEQLLQQDSTCKAHRNYTVLARAADASRLLRVTVLAAPSFAAAACRRLCVERRCFVAGDASASVEAAENLTIVFVAIGRCPGAERTGFTLKLQSIQSPPLRSSPADGGLSEAGVTAVVAALITFVYMYFIIVVAVTTIQRRRLRNGVRRVMRTGKASRNSLHCEAPATPGLSPPEDSAMMAVNSNSDRLSAMYSNVDTKDCLPSPTYALCDGDESEYCKLSGTAFEHVYSQLSAV